MILARPPGDGEDTSVSPLAIQNSAAATCRRILVVEDDERIARSLVHALTEEGYDVEHVADGAKVEAALHQSKFDLMLLDLMLPGLDGLSILKAMKVAGNPTPVIVLSALTDLQDRLPVLRAGADDYLQKPLSSEELCVRIDNLIRRSVNMGDAPNPILQFEDLRVDLLERQVTRGATVIELKSHEFTLLELFLRNPGRILTKTLILERVWNYRFDPQTNVVDVLVCRLRAKIDRGFPTRILHTIRGMGYVLKRE